MSNLLNTASLVVTPNSYKEGTLFSVIPNTGAGDMTVVRATTATRVNSAGLVEVVPYNLVTWSEMFSDASWSKTNTSITPNTTTAPNGTLTADTLSIGVDASSVRHRLHTNSIGSQVVGTIYTGTYYLKANQHQWIQILGNIGYSIGVWANFDLINGVIGNTGGVDTTASIENVGNGWYRCRVSGLATATSTTFFEVITTDNTNSGRYPSYQSLVAQDVCYVWGAQLVEGTLPLTYQATTTRLNIPRLDYSLGSCPNLLLEPQRTNLALRSEEFDNATWFKTAGIVVTPNALISPSGVVNADYIQFGASNRLISQTTSLGIGVVSTGSIYIKGTAGETIALGVGGLDTLFTLNGNWQRIEATKTSVNAVFNINTFGGATARNIYIWGAQLEAGAYATSYIPTTTASVTRNADVVQTTGISSLIGQFEGTMVFNINVIQPTGLGVQLLLKVSNDSEVQPFIISSVGNTGLIGFDFYIGGTYTFSLTSPSAISAGLNTVAVTYKTGSYKLFLNGVQVATSTNSTAITNTISKLRLLSGAAPMYYNFVSVWKEALNDEQLESLTGTGFNSYAAMASFYNYTLQ